MEPVIDTAGSPAGLDEVRRRRAELGEAIAGVRAALAADAEPDPATWCARLHTSLVALDRDVAIHITVTEGPDGLHQAILAGDLRLANQVDALAAEHPPIAAEVAEVRVHTAAPPDVTGIDSLREQVGAMIETLVRHRQRGADLVYEAFHTDIGGTE
jgi:hypothetical protein